MKEIVQSAKAAKGEKVENLRDNKEITVRISSWLLEKIASLIELYFKQLIKINLNEYKICNEINSWINFEMKGHEPTKRIFMKNGWKRMNENSELTLKIVFEKMLIQEWHSIGPTNIKLNKVDNTTMMNLQLLIDKFKEYNTK